MAAMPVVKVIYAKPMLPDLARVLACLCEKEIKFELEDMNKGMKMSQDILNLQISSRGHIPVLLDGHDELFGSRKICRHIVEKYGAYGYQCLLGKDPLARVSVEQWIQSEEHMFEPPSSSLVFYLAYKIEADEEKASQTEKKLEKVLNLYEQRLGECEFLAGNYFTLADLYHLPNTHYLKSSAEYGYLFKNRKNVSRWWKNISGRDSWKKVVKRFEEEGLRFYVSAGNNDVNQSFPSQHKNGIREGTIEGSEIGSKQQEDKSSTTKSKGDVNALTGKKETVQSKHDGEKDQAHSAGIKEHSANLENKKHDTNELKDENKGSKPQTAKNEQGSSSNIKEKNLDDQERKPEETGHMIERNTEKNKPGVKDKSSSVSKSKSGTTDESKESDANKPAAEDTKTLKPDDNINATSDDKKSVKTEEVKIHDANKPDNEDMNKRVKPDEKDKALSANNKKPVIADESKEQDASKSKTEGKKDDQKADDKERDATGKTERQDKALSGNDMKSATTDESKEQDAIKSKIEGKKDDQKADDKRDATGKTEIQNKTDENKVQKLVDSNNKEKKNELKSDDKDKDKALPGTGITDESKEHVNNTEGKKDAQKADDKERDASGKSERQDKTEENKEQKPVYSNNEAKKEELKSDDKDKVLSGKEKEQDANKQNNGRDTTDPEDKKGLAPTEKKNETSSSDNKNPSTAAGSSQN